ARDERAVVRLVVELRVMDLPRRCGLAAERADERAEGRLVDGVAARADQDEVAEVEARVEREGRRLGPLGLTELRVPGGPALRGQVAGKQHGDACECEPERDDPGADRPPGMAAARPRATLRHVAEFRGSA